MRSVTIAGVVLLLLAAAAAPGISQDRSETATQGIVPENPGGEQTPLGEPSASEGGAQVPLVSTWDFVRMILVLAAVIGFIYLLFVLLRRSGRRRVVENDLIRVLGSRTLSGNRSLHLVSVGRSVYLVGSSEGSVGLVSEITDRESADTVLLEAQKQPGGTRKSFSEVLGGLFSPAPAGLRATALNGMGANGGLPGIAGRIGGLGFIRKQRQRLKGL